MNIEKVLEERGSRYGKFEDNARITQELMRVLESAPNYHLLEDMHKECFHMICHKMARSVCGDPNYDDNSRDIAGYATGLTNYLQNKNIIKETIFENKENNKQLPYDTNRLEKLCKQ